MVESKKKTGKGLGKGLDALMRSNVLENTHTDINVMPGTHREVHAVGEHIVMLDPASIRPNPKQPRRVFNEEALAELAVRLGTAFRNR